MALNNKQDYVTFELEYKATNKSQIKLFDSNFVNMNIDKCKIIYNDKEFDLMEYFTFDNNYNHNDSIKIQLRINNNITDISHMFDECKELLSISYLSVGNFNITDINKSFDGNNFNNSSKKADNSNEIDISETFYNDNLTLSSIQKNINSPAYNEIKESNNFKENIFANVKHMSRMFNGCSSLILLPDISNFDTKNVTDMHDMFYKCSSLIALPDISKWITKNVTNMSLMFSGCFSLISLPDISKWDTKNVTDMDGIFSKCSSLISLPDISKWDLKNATYMSGMFNECSSLISLPDISKWDTENVKYMYAMFYGCHNLLNYHH